MIANAIYVLALAILSPWIAYRRYRYGRYRRGWSQKLFGLSASQAKSLRRVIGSSQCVWFHAVSVGEVNLLKGVIGQLERHDPKLTVLISSSTDTGYDLAVERFGKDRVFFCPCDFSWAVRRTLRQLDPAVLVLAELELWPNLIRLARARDTEVIVINGRLSDSSAAGYQRFSVLTRSIFSSLSRVLCQDEQTAANFIACGTAATRISISGSLKFDDAPTTRECVDVESRSQWAGVDPWHRVWVVGSTQEGEEQMALSVYRRLIAAHSELRLVLVPRHPERFDGVAQLIETNGLAVQRRSTSNSMQDQSWESERVVLIDSIGELRHWWGVGQIATVGGSFGDRGGQNMLEPAGYGSAVSFGPNTRNFRDIAQRLLDAEGAVRVANEAELEAFVQRCLTDIPAADALGRAARRVVQQHRGATQRTIETIASFTDRADSTQRHAA